MIRLSRTDALRLHGLHLLTRLALRMRKPLQAKALVDRIGRRVLNLSNADEARAAMMELFPRGTCLSRAMTIAAGTPDAEVVIGIDVWSSARTTAHAWLQIGEVCVDTRPPGAGHLPDELTRLPPRATASAAV